MSRRIRRLREWAVKNLSGVVQEKTWDLCDKQPEWSVWYDHENAHATSNMLDRLMRSQNGYLGRGQHYSACGETFHGDLKSANLRSRVRAILHNYWPWGPESVVENDGASCPAERLNKKRYSDNRLENLLAAASLEGKKIANERRCMMKKFAGNMIFCGVNSR
jgi:hypothetical protein